MDRGGWRSCQLELFLVSSRVDWPLKRNNFTFLKRFIFPQRIFAPSLLPFPFSRLELKFSCLVAYISDLVNLVIKLVNNDPPSVQSRGTDDPATTTTSLSSVQFMADIAGSRQRVPRGVVNIPRISSCRMDGSIEESPLTLNDWLGC